MRKLSFKTAVLATLVAGFSLVSCEKNEEESTPRIGLEFSTVTTASSLKSTKQETKMISFHSGFITLREIEFEVEVDDDSLEIDFNIEMNTVIDFASGETTPDISFAEIPAGTYNEMEVEIELQDEGDNPSVVLNGTFIDANGINHDIRFEFNSGETFEVEREGTVVFASNESALAQITIDPAAWFINVSSEQLSSATKDINGIIVISETQNPDIFDVVADGLDLATEVEIEN